MEDESRDPFGATAPPFIDYLKDILRRYPDGGQILKELIQNAEDADATRVVFIHDDRNYGTKDLCFKSLDKYQGPALYAYNNAQFTEEDWKSIQKVGRSDKRDDPNKVGRFGLGFNSVYHVTDVTCIFSGGHLGMMDPQEQIFGERKGGFRWSLKKECDRKALLTMTDQFQPFRDIVSLVSGQEWARVVQEDQNFNGTLFRFPLRSKASEISHNVYNDEKVIELFDSFIADAELSLLFLKNVSSVSLIHIDAKGSDTTRLNLESYEGVTEGCTRIKTITLKSDVSRETKWLVTSCTMNKGNVKELDDLAQRLKFVPRVDLAFPCTDGVECCQSRLCCFLPLPNNEPNKTGLPVYVNAYFGLTDNRRYIKWLEEDQRNDEHAKWNELLIKEVLPQTYLTIIQHAIRLVQDNILPINSIYNLWPDISKVKHKERWHEVALDVLGKLFSQDSAVLSLAKDERHFVPFSDAVLPCNGPTTSETLQAIKRILVSCDINLVTLTETVSRAIEAAHPDSGSLTHVTPAFLRNILRDCRMTDISDADTVTLLEFVLSDQQYKELQGLQLLPLSDGSFKSFTKREEDTVLIDSEEFPRALLPFSKNLFLRDGLSPDCVNHLREIAEKGLYTVTNVDAVQVVRFTKSHLPNDWKQTENRLVTWDVSSVHHPPLSWLQELWTFFSSHFTELSDFIGLPLIPVNTMSSCKPVKLAKLEKNPTLIFEKHRETVLPHNITQLVNKVGGTVINENNWLRHEDLDSYVLSPAPKHVLQVLVNLQTQQVIQELRSVPKTTLEELKDYISRLVSLSECEQELLLQMPLFQTMTGQYTSAQSKRAVTMISELTIPTDVPMNNSVIKCATEADRRLLHLLNISVLDTAHAAGLLIDSVESKTCSKADTEKIMTWILQHGNILFPQNPDLKRRCANLSFIEISRELKKASSLFDPRVHTFKVLFEEKYFPPAVYTKNPQMLDSLTALGLIHREVDVSPEHLLHAAAMMQKLAVTNPKEALKRTQLFLNILDDLLEKFTSDELKQLKNLKWMPVTEQNDSIKSGFFCPEEMRHSMYEDVVGYVMPLDQTLSKNICNKLGLDRKPPPEKVVANLSVLISKVGEIPNPDIDVDFKRKLQSIYGHMQKYINEYTALISRETQWLWNRSRFVAPKELVAKYPNNLDLSSHVGKIPDEFLPYKSLFLSFGLREELTDEEIVHLLSSIKKTIESREVEVATSSEVKVSIDILNWICREKKEVVCDNIPVPVILQPGQYTMKPKSATVFCDLSKKGLKELEGSQEEMHVVHEEIPITTAEFLDIQLLSTFILDPELVGIEQCGQTEPITTRIKNILKEYDEESDIFKEIIQNAEDAGADTCKFLVDFRVHKDDPESLIDPNMQLCQGPCVWAFNNEQFSKNDWDNIVRVGSASKENKVEKIGMFGLGFNTVYHVTDIPSILSGSTLLILDPNTTHLKKRIKHKSNPGIKLDLSQQHFQWFPGQFAPYEGVFDFSGVTSKDFSGTLIKLPFRTEEESHLSEISTKVYSKQDIITLQKHFAKDSQSHLIFLRNIDTVSLQTASINASTPLKHGDIEDIFTVSKTTLRSMDVHEEVSLSMQHHAEDVLLQLSRKCKDMINFRKVDIVKITSHKQDEAQVQCWLLYNCFGAEESLKMATDKNKELVFSLPVGGVALPLQFNHETDTFVPSQTNHVGQAFCFLPLSISTGLPFNVNGTFAVTSNRKGLWESGVKREWNKSLLQDPLVTAFITALLALKEMSQNMKLENYSYHTFWPDMDKVSETFKPLVDAFYCRVAQFPSSPTLFSDGKNWFSLENALFLHETMEKDQNIFTLAMQVCQTHVESRHVVPLPGWIRNSFKHAGLEMVLQEKTWNWEKFYKEAVFKNLDQMDPEWRDTLVLHALHLNMKEIDSLLVSYPCIPTTNGQLQYIQNLVDPKGKVACLFEQEEGRLLGGTVNDFCSTENVLRLQRLGMATDDLSLEDITTKAEAVRDVWNNDKDKAHEHIKCLLELLKLHNQNEDPSFWKTLSATPFLPAFTRRDAKIQRHVTLQRPADVFTDKCDLLVNMTQPVLDLSELKIHPSDPVLQRLGVNDNPSPKVVVEQLKQASAQCQSLDKLVLDKIASECYEFLDHCLCDSYNDTQDVILQTLTSFPFVLVDDKFVSVSCVAETAHFEARPYLYVLPYHFSNFQRLWEIVGVQKEFTLSQCMEALNDIHSKYDGKPLSKTDLTIYLDILNKGIFEAKEDTENCLVPNQNEVLQPAATLFYNDSPWMPVDKSVTYCHENISQVMAIHLGIKTTKQHMLKSRAVGNLSPFAFKFQQHEKLTVRIKNIIQAYPSKKDILKELIQNADDAEATEIHFVWDKRRHNTEKTFGDKWNDLQGPALCVFNNKVFSDADLKGIQDLGEGGKHNSPGKTGKYGLGFNSVYHLTDCPSILTGDKWLCVSDPNKQYIEDTSDAGIGCELDDDFKQMYMDVYSTFLPDQFDLNNGTMFRLPLRTTAMAVRSEISHNVVTDLDMSGLCRALSEDPEGLILFVEHISKIQISEIDTSGELHTIFSVNKHVPETSVCLKDAFIKLKKNAFLSDLPVDPQKAIYEMVITLLKKDEVKETDWIIAAQFQSADYKEKIANAAVAACVRQKSSQQEAEDHSKKLGPREKKKADQFKGVAFCSLPLPGHTGLPVHVNANFEVDFSRKNLWIEDEQSPKMGWNKYLRQSVIAPLYAHLLQHLRCTFADEKHYSLHFLKESFLRFFPPETKQLHQDWQEMAHEVYRSIQKQRLDVIPVLKPSSELTTDNNAKKYRFDWCSMSESEPTKIPHLLLGTSEEIRKILEDIGMRLVPSCMQNVWSSFRSAGIELSYVNPKGVQTFLRAKPLNDPSLTEKQLPLPIAETLIKDEQRCSELLNFCLKELKNTGTEEDTKANSDVINGLPLLLTKDKVLRVFDISSPKLVSQYEQLFIDHEDQMADYEINIMHLYILKSCGFVKSLTLRNAEEFLKPFIEQLFERCDIDGNGHYIPTEEITVWLKHLWKFIISELNTSGLSIDSQSRLTFAGVRQLYSDCCILPVICPRNEKKYLRTMADMPSVIEDSAGKDLSSTLFKLGFMKHDSSFFKEMELELYSHLHSELFIVTDYDSVLDQLYKIDASEFSNLSPTEINELQNFLNLGVTKTEDRQEYQRKFKSLPLFETISGDRVIIEGSTHVYVIDLNDLERFPDLWTLPDMNAIFLKNSPENLQIPRLSDLEFFVQFILPVAHKLTQHQKLDCLKLLLSIQHNYEYPEYKEQIISTFSDLKLICTTLGRLESASYFFDYEEELFKEMLPKDRFIPNTFWDALTDNNTDRRKQSKDFLEELGMRVKVSEDDIITFAHQVEKEATRKPLTTMKKKSEVVFKAALKFMRDSKNNRKNLLYNIASINFIFPVKIKEELCNYHPPFASGRTAVTIRGALIEDDKRHQELIWSSMPIIHVPVDKSEKLVRMLCDSGAFENPPSGKVTEHMSNICLSPCENQQKIQTRTRVFHSLYQVLSSNPFNSQSLAGLPLILVENNKKLVKADHVSVSLENADDFRPYLYKIPSEFDSYRNFFVKLGVAPEPTLIQFCNVLAAIHKETINKHSLQQNQQKTVSRAVQQLFVLLMTAKGEQCLDDVKTLYLPGVNGKLHDSRTLYYNNTAYTERLEKALPEKFVLLEKLSRCHLGEDAYEHQWLLKRLPQRLQPQMLSQITEEKVLEAQMELCERNCEFSSFFRKHLSSPAFRFGLVCLVRAQSGGKITQQQATEMCNRTFERIKIICCERLCTELWLEKQPLPNTIESKDVYVKQEQQDCIFYLKHHKVFTSKVEQKSILTLAQEIVHLLDEKLSIKLFSILQQLFHCDSKKDVKELLSENQIRVEIDTYDLDSPAAGTEIPEEWHDALDMSILKNFEAGEYVGLLSNGKYIYAVIVEELPGHSGQFTQRFKIDIGQDEPIEVSYLDLYQFKREQQPKALCVEFDLVEGATPHSSSQHSTRRPLVSLEEAKKEIDKCLNNIWTLPEEERKKVIARLYLRWHPDKNVDCPSIATGAFQFLQHRIEELVKRKLTSSKSTGSTSTNYKSSASTSTNFKSSASTSTNFESTASCSSSSFSEASYSFRVFYHEWDKKARHHRASRERFHTGNRTYNFWTFNDNVPQPNRGEATRWCRQAQCDLKAASNDTDKGHTEWCLFKLHQAVEKSLIAASYRNNGKHPNCSSISSMASKVSGYSPQLRGLTQLIRDLTDLDVDAKKTQYPNYHSFPNIPNGQFSSANERRAVEKASEILALIQTYVTE